MIGVLLLAGAFTLAAAVKWHDRQEFERYLRPLAARHAARLARIVVIVEAALAVALASALIIGTVRSIAASVALVFLLGATVAHGVRLAGREPPTCQCFGRLSDSTERVDPSWHPAFFGLRNGALAAISASVAGWSAAGTGAAAGVIALIVAFALLISIARERALLAQEVHPLSEHYGRGMRTLLAHTWWVNGRPRPF